MVGLQGGDWNPLSLADRLNYDVLLAVTALLCKDMNPVFGGLRVYYLN